MRILAVALVLCWGHGLLAGIVPRRSFEQFDSSREVEDMMRVCLADIGLDTALVEALDEPTPKILVPPTEKINCYVACMYRKLKIMRADGSIYDFASEEVPEWTPSVIEQCRIRAGNDVCALAACLDESYKLFL